MLHLSNGQFAIKTKIMNETKKMHPCIVAEDALTGCSCSRIEEYDETLKAIFFIWQMTSPTTEEQRISTTTPLLDEQVQSNWKKFLGRQPKPLRKTGPPTDLTELTYNHSQTVKVERNFDNSNLGILGGEADPLFPVFKEIVGMDLQLNASTWFASGTSIFRVTRFSYLPDEFNIYVYVKNE